MDPHDEPPKYSAQESSALLGWAKAGYWEDDLMQYAFSSDDSDPTAESSLEANRTWEASDF